MADNLGMVMTIRADAKGLVAEMKNAEGQVVQTARVMRSELKGAADSTGNSFAKLKTQMGQSRETAMFFTQALGEFGPQGKTAQIAISGIAGAVMGGGGILLALSLAQAAVRLLVDWWKADAEAAKKASEEHQKAAEAVEKYNRALARDSNSQIATLKGMVQSFDKLTEAQKAHNVVQEVNVLMLRATAPAVRAMLSNRLEEARRLEAIIKQKEQELALDKARKEWNEKENQVKTVDQVGVRTSAILRVEKVATDSMAALDKAEAAYFQKSLARIAAKIQSEVELYGRLAATIANDLGQAFAQVLLGTQSLAAAVGSVMKSTLNLIIDVVKQEIMANAVAAAAAAYKSQAGIPIAGPFLAAAAMVAALSTVQGLVASVPSAAGGLGQVQHDTFAFIHKDETVLPAALAKTYRELAAGGGGGGGSNVTLNISAVDAQGVRRLLLDNGPALAEAIGKAARDGRRFG